MLIVIDVDLYNTEGSLSLDQMTLKNLKYI